MLKRGWPQLNGAPPRKWLHEDMSPSQQEHYVSQAYLRRFAHNATIIHVFDKKNLRSFKTNIRNVAAEKGFYDLPKQPAADHGVDPQLPEKTLAELEKMFDASIARVLRLVDLGADQVIDESARLEIAHFLVVQNTRTRESRALIAQIFQKLGESLLPGPVLPDGSTVKVEANEDWVRLFQTAQIFNPHTLQLHTKALLSHIWFVGLNKTEQRLYSSDHPFVKRAHYQDPYLSTLGLASPGIELACPLSPNHVLILCDRTAFQAYEPSDNKSVRLTSDNVTYYNSLQVFQSYRQVYSVAADFTLALRVCREHPEARQAQRTRVVVE